MPYTTVINFTAGNALPAADLNSNFDNLDYLNAKINEQIQISAGAMVPSKTPAAASEYETATNKLIFPTMDFADTGGYLYADFGFILPSDYNSGTVTAVFHWTANSTSTNSVNLSIAGICFADDSSLDQAFGTAQTVTDANKSTAYDLNITGATSAITIAGTPAPGKYVQFRIYRGSGEAGDTLAATARVLAVVITYTRA